MTGSLEVVKAFTVHRPWAWAICHAGKTIENRGRQTTHRGLVAVHAGLSEGSGRPWLTEHGFRPPQDLVGGHVVAVAQLADCTRDAPATIWAVPGLWHWQLEHVTRLAVPVPCRGQLGLWTVPEQVEDAILDQLTDPSLRLEPAA
jgi:hypothetical protein